MFIKVSIAVPGTRYGLSKCEPLSLLLLPISGLDPCLESLMVISLVFSLFFFYPKYFIFEVGHLKKCYLFLAPWSPLPCTSFLSLHRAGPSLQLQRSGFLLQRLLFLQRIGSGALGLRELWYTGFVAPQNVEHF